MNSNLRRITRVFLEGNITHADDERARRRDLRQYNMACTRRVGAR